MRSNIYASVLLISMTLTPGVVHAVFGDITLQRAAGDASAADTPPAVFPHWKHRIHYKCYVCHNAIFEMKAGANKISMKAIADGKYCGACHNGKQAWAVGFDSCNKCHKQE